MSVADARTADAIVREFSDLHKRFRVVIHGLDQAALDRAPRAGENSIGVLVWHALGAQRHMLRNAAGRPSERDREAEFRALPTSSALAELIDEAERLVPDLVKAALQRAEPPSSGGGRSIHELIVHALAHSGEHLGHAELTRKLIEP